MSSYTRVRRSVQRGMSSDGLYLRRNLKAHKQYNRWYNGILVEPFKDLSGRTYWRKRPTGRNLIHKGRKP